MRALVFDLDGTLLHFEEGYDEVIREAIEHAGGDASEETLERYLEAFFEHFSRCEPDPVQRGFEATDLEVDPQTLADSLLTQEVERARTPEGALADLERLSETHAIGVLTNGVRSWQERKLEAHGFGGVVDAFVASYEVGAHKPTRGPFAELEDRLPATAYAMIGDSDSDVDGADAVGWESHRYTGGGFGGLPDTLEWGEDDRP